MERQICSNCGQMFEWSPEFYRAKGLQAPPLHCPECADRALGKSDHHVAKARECLQQFSCVDVSAIVAMASSWRTIQEQDGRPIRPYRRLTIKGAVFGASWSGRIDVFDQRADPTAALAAVRVMRTTHEAGATLTAVHVDGPRFPWFSRTTSEYEAPREWDYLVLDDAQGNEPTARLIYTSAIQKWNRDDRIEGDPLWQCRIHGASRSGMHSGHGVLALVDAEHPLTVTRVHDKGALHQGDRLRLRTASPEQAMLLLVRKAEKPVDVIETIYDGEEE